MSFRVNASDPRCNPDWPDECNAVLRRLWSSDSTVPQIVVAIERETGRSFTANAVIGRARRLKLGAKGKKPTVSRAENVKRRKAPVLKAKAPAPESYRPKIAAPETHALARNLRLVDPRLRPNMCRFIVDPANRPDIHNMPKCNGDSIMCAADVVAGHSWCAVHVRIVYQPRGAAALS